MKPFAAVQALLKRGPEGPFKGYLGSAFRLTAPRHYITAAHCVLDMDAADIGINNPFEASYAILCANVSYHPSADVALVEAAEELPENFERFLVRRGHLPFGAAVHSFGVVTDASGSAKDSAHRTVGGILQREFPYSDPHFQYRAAELSFPIPLGMSGGPVFLAHQPNTAIAVATGTLESEIEVRRIEEIEQDGQVFRERISSVSHFGLAALIDPISEWIEDTTGHKLEHAA